MAQSSDPPAVPPAGPVVGPEPGPAPEDEASAGAAAAREQFAATSEILMALGRAGSDPGVILDTIVERAAALCGADVGQLYLVRDGLFELSRIHGDSPEAFVQHLSEHPLGVTRASLMGRVALDRRVQQIPDVLADPDYGRRDLQQVGGFRTLMSAPMLVEDQVVGALSVWRLRVLPFDQRAMDLLGVFAAQAAIVINNVTLVRELESRSTELATKLEQLEALREVGEAVSSTLNLDEVLDTIVLNAVRLTGTDGGSIMECEDAEGTFSVRSVVGSGPGLVARLRGLRIAKDDSAVLRAAWAREPLEVADLVGIEHDQHLQLLYEDGWRSVLAVPMVRADRVIGALVVRRRRPGGFPEDTRELLETLATQSALALVNARLFRELETKSDELEIASRHKSEFLASMSHELRTPLNAVIGFSEVLIDRMFGDINERQEEYLRDIWNSGRHLLELLNEILDLSKVEAGQMQLDMVEFPVASTIEYATSLLRERAAVHGISVGTSVTPPDATVVADELRVRQVIVNLLTNAVKFTPDGGAVRIHAELNPAERGAGSAEELRVTVTDTGIGVPLEDRERIFESFQQGRRGTTKEEGTGLGLTLSRRIVELLGGRMWLRSEVGVGSTFGFAIPARATRAPSAEPAGQRPSPGDRPTVVLVDDDRASLDLLSAYLSGGGVTVATASDGRQGLDVIRRTHPAAVVLDLRLPVLDGWEVLEALKSDPGTSPIPVVIASILDARPRGLAAGAAEYLTKPVSRDDLVGALSRCGLALPGGGP